MSILFDSFAAYLSTKAILREQDVNKLAQIFENIEVGDIVASVEDSSSSN
jgi:hypothetical protein